MGQLTTDGDGDSDGGRGRKQFRDEGSDHDLVEDGHRARRDLGRLRTAPESRERQELTPQHDSAE
jgi:hypothetical protein